MRRSLALGILTLFAAAQVHSQAVGRGLQEAHALVAAEGVQSVVAVTESTVVAHMMENDPHWAPYQDLLKEWAAKVYDWNRLEPLLASQLAQSFTPEELAELARFYSTPVGKKWVAFKPSLQRGISTLLFSAQQQFRPDLRRRVRARYEESQKALPKLD